MAQDVGSAYVQILPSARGFSKAVEQDMGGAFDSSERRGSSVFRGLFANVAKWGAAAAAALGVLFTGWIIKGGISRQLNIEDAQAKLRGLGHDAASVEAIMSDALGAVRGTAYGLDTAATVAASAVAAGIKPGQELERYLRLTADAATIAGSSMQEMGDIINQVTSKGYAGMENLNRLTERGIPIMQWLADEYGVTQEALQRMVSAGEVDAETFRKVIEDNIGGAALASGETTRGAFSNMGAAFSRLGVTITSGVFPHFKTFFNEVTTFVDGLNEKLGPFAERFAGWFEGTIAPALDGLGERALSALDTVSGLFSGLDAGPLSGILTVLQDVGSAIWDALGPAIEQLGPQVLEIAGYFSPLGLALKALGPVLPQIAGSLTSLGSALGGALAAVLPVVADVLGQVAGVLSGVLAAALPVAVDLIVTLVDAFSALLPAIGPLVGVIGGVLTTVLQAVAPILMELVTIFAQHLAGLIPTLVPVITILAEAIGGILTAVLPLVPVLLSLVTALLPLLPVFSQLITALLPVVISLIGALLPVVVGLVGVLVSVLVPVISVVGDILGWLIGIIADVLTWFINLVGGAEGMGSTLSGIWTSIKNVASNIWNGIISFFTGIPQRAINAIASIANLAGRMSTWIGNVRQAAVDKFNELVSFVTGIPGRIISALGNVGTMLRESGRKIIQGLIDGISSMISNVTDAVGGVLESARDLLPFSPAKKGPFSGRGWTLYSGRSISTALAQGIRDETSQVVAAARDLVDAAHIDGVLPDLGAGSGFTGNGVFDDDDWQGPRTSVTQNVYPQPGQSEQSIGDAAARRLTFAMQG